MQTALYGKIKEKNGESLIGPGTQNLLDLWIVATQRKTKEKTRKARRHAGAC